MPRLWSTIEYKLSNEQNRWWANQTLNSVISAKDNITDFPEKISLSIKTNRGLKDLELNIKLDSVNKIVPDLLWSDFNYMLKGKTIRGIGAIFITSKTFNEHPTINALNKQVEQLVNVMKEERFANIVKELRDRLSPAAREAITDDLQTWCERSDTCKLRKWFVKHEFINAPSLSELTRMKELGYMHGAAKSNSKGFTQGKATYVDWEKKTFFTTGYTSD